MQDPSGSTEIAESQDDDLIDTGESTVLAEVLPGIAVVFGDVPADLKHDLIDFGLVPVADRTRISTLLASIGNTAHLAGTVGTAFAGMQGLYRISDATRALLMSGAALAVKDGANLGTVIAQGRFIAQARFIPVQGMKAAQGGASIGPALSMLALQMMLEEVTALVRTNIALTSQVLAAVRHEQWAELTALVTTVDDVVDQARAIESVPSTLWETVAGKKADLQKQLELYRLNVGAHVRQIQRLGLRGRREYLEINAEAVLFDAFALLSSVKAWTAYQSLHAVRARSAASDDPAEGRLVEDIARRTGQALKSALAETTSLVDSLRRELRIIAELPGRATVPLPGKRKDSNAVRQTAAALLEALEPLADALHPAAPPLEAPAVVCAPATFKPEPTLRILQWHLRDDETLSVLALSDQGDSNAVSSLFTGAKEKLTGAVKTLVAVTDRRILTARTNSFLEQGEIRQDIPLDQVRYVRSKAADGKGDRRVVDVITRDENLQWLFPAEIDPAQIDGLAALLAEAMSIPDAEREELRDRATAGRPSPAGL
ncbi:hypothetical protein OWR29_36580 [Actinoplanes sp. Pm04-4]|uniref:DUF222 domain-containing protein n=1 Tax=Paractinoplanes pyxinae TaxID=2997416 RepID=A0ABT4BD61_9ACTN|nr:hypothetical protein [Actinoplanes pyxinae]MCY1143548.1 hypothetical protein [Actinoplanes pyxinae]